MNLSKQQTSFRTHNCGELRDFNIGGIVTLCGWVQELQNRKLAFINLRDRYGLTQIIIDPQNVNYQLAISLKREYVIQVIGKVMERSAKNPNIPTGNIEIVPTEIILINESMTPPFLIEDKTNVNIDTRLKYRYLDIRRKPVLNALILRNEVAHLTRTFLRERDFLEIETPILVNVTEGGAHNFLVPSKTKDHYYALAQSPQLLKQSLMIAGVDRYYQLARCFRSEQGRADRICEFTQIDIETSFMSQQDIINMFENYMKNIFKTIHNIDFLEPFPTMEYCDAIKFYGIDKPDLRFGCPFVEITNIVTKKGFALFDNAEIIVGICVPGLGNSSKNDIKQYLDMSQEAGSSSLVWVKTHEKPTSSVNKYYTEDELKTWCNVFNASDNDLILIFAGLTNKTRIALGKFRLAMGDKLNLRNPMDFKPLWIVNFPLFEWNETENKYNSAHHPFTSPLKEDMKLFETDLSAIRAQAYDLVINGCEVGGGSIRIHDAKLQTLIFNGLGFTEKEIEEQFGFLINALGYGAPIHGGLAFGLDRLVALLMGSQQIVDVIAFPKNSNGRCPLMNSPNQLSQKQLDELHIAVTSNK